MEARYYTAVEGGVECHLCPHKCKIFEGKVGRCHVRKCSNGKLATLSYGVISSLALDPIEKKPLYHFHPGSKVLSIGSVGCNFKCQFCQNHTISFASERDISRYQQGVDPHWIVRKASDSKKDGGIGVAFTYNEPIVNFEFMMDVARLVKKSNMLNVMVSNGFICKEPLAEILKVVDAFNIDLKGYSNDFYRRVLGGKKEPVEQCLVEVAKAGRHLEISYLVIPGMNDDYNQFIKVCRWIASNLPLSIVLHINRYFPTYHFSQSPPSLVSMLDLYSIAKEVLPNVYLGNTGLPQYNNTYCPSCGRLLVERLGYDIYKIGLTTGGSCVGCGASPW